MMNPTGSPGKAACWRARGQPLGAQSPERGGAEWVWGGGGNKWGALGPQMLMGSVVPEPTLPARHFEIQRAPANRILFLSRLLGHRCDFWFLSTASPCPPPRPHHRLRLRALHASLLLMGAGSVSLTSSDFSANCMLGACGQKRAEAPAHSRLLSQQSG